jgi:hypothetical protein
MRPLSRYRRRTIAFTSFSQEGLHILSNDLVEEDFG